MSSILKYEPEQFIRFQANIVSMHPYNTFARKSVILVVDILLNTDFFNDTALTVLTIYGSPIF